MARTRQRLSSLAVPLLLLAAPLAPVAAQNLLPNPGFDTDLSSWTIGAFQSAWSADDANGSPTSGSAEGIHALEEASGGGFLQSSCLPILAGETYDLGADLLLPSSQSDGRVSISLWTFSDTRCRNTVQVFGNGFTRIHSQETTGTWTPVGSQFEMPDGVVAGYVSLSMAKSVTGGEVHAFVDNPFLCLAGTCGPGAGTNTDPCVADADTACLLDDRFEVMITWSDFQGGTGKGNVMSFGAERAESDQSAFFWFFEPTNFEMGVKMVDACAPPFDRFWVFVSGLTNVGYVVTVRDTVTGELRAYTNPLGTLPTTVGDTNAFACVN